jgi:hypothetical protein
MDMHRFDPHPSASAPHSPLAHAGEVAQWVLLLLGWIWLGEQGMRLGWSLASGVLAVALWWAARLLCRGSDWALHARPWAMAVCGGLSALGVWLPELLRSWDAPALNLSHIGLLVLALLWGAWSGMVETRSRVSTFDLGPVAWHPVLAAGLVGGLWWGTQQTGFAPWGVSGLLAFCAIVLFARDRAQLDAPIACRGHRAHGFSLLAPSAMGLMMGSLWLGPVWCAGLGWAPQEMVLWHLALMAVLPALVAWWGRLKVSPSSLSGLSLPLSAVLPRALEGFGWGSASTSALLALGALMLWGQSAWSGLLAMLLPSLAWAIHCSRPRRALDRATPPSLWWRRCLALFLGPGLLVWVGAASAVQGPLAMQTAMALIGLMALVHAFLGWTRQPVPMATWSAP